ISSDSAGFDFKRRHHRWPYRKVLKGAHEYKDPDSWNRVLEEAVGSSLSNVTAEIHMYASCTSCLGIAVREDGFN
nr:hypothetical protein [Tanacetum cinerariifolium]